MYQLDIFSFLEDPSPADFRDMSEEEIANYIGSRVGLQFSYNSLMNQYEVKIKKVVFAVSKSTYTYSGAKGVPFISCDVQKQGGDFMGVGSPEDSLEDAIAFFNKNIDRFLGGITK